MRSVRFWTSLVRKNCHDISGAIELCWLLAIGKASWFGSGLDISIVLYILVYFSSHECSTRNFRSFFHTIFLDTINMNWGCHFASSLRVLIHDTHCGFTHNALWPFLENFVQKCLSPNFEVWMILFVKPIPDTLKINNWYHIFIFYAPFILSFNSKVAKILCFACFCSLLLWSNSIKYFSRL